MTRTTKDAVGIGVIGAGFARTTQIPGFRAQAGARVVAIASGRRENAERVAREFEIEHVAADWRDIIARDDVHLVSIVTPPSTHAEMALAALAAGKAVLCEKPMAMNAQETARMREAARSSGLLAHIDHELRFLPARRRMREMIAGGEIGRVRHLKFLFRSDSRVAPRGWNWWSEKDMGGGALGAIGSHAVDTFCWLTGARVSRVSARLATHVPERADESGALRAVTTDDEANLLLDLSDNEVCEGATASVSLSVVEPGEPRHEVEIFGSAGALKIGGESDLWRARVGDGRWSQVETERAPLAAGMRDNEWSRAFTLFAGEIVGALREGRERVEDAATFDDGHHIQLVLDAARRADADGSRVTLTGDNE